MTGGKALLIALCGGLVALMLVVYNSRRDVVGESDLGTTSRATTDGGFADGNSPVDRGAAGGGVRSGGTGSNPLEPGGSDRQAKDGSERRGDRMSPQIADARRRLAARDEAARDAGTDELQPSAGAPRAGQDLLSEAQRDRMAAAAANGQVGAAPERPSDVAYDGADQVFEAQTWVEGPRIDPITTTAGSMSFWVKPEWDNDDPGHAHLLQLGESGPRMVRDGNFVRFEYTDVDGGNQLGGSIDTRTWAPDEWRYVTGTWEDGVLTLYVDGKAVYANTPERPPPWEDAPRLYVGTRPPLDGRIIPPAFMSQITVMNRSLSVEEVQSQFASARRPDK